MVSRRDTLKVVVSSLLASKMTSLVYAQATGSISRVRATDPACGTCSVNEEMRTHFAKPLPSSPDLKNISLPQFLRPIKRSTRIGTIRQFVETATGSLTFGIQDLRLVGKPGIKLTRYYHSAASKNVGLGPGWSTNYDDEIVVDKNGATFFAASGYVQSMPLDSDGVTFRAGKPGWSIHNILKTGGDNKLLEKIGALVTKTYSADSEGIYRLAAIDYGDYGQLLVERDRLGRLLSVHTTTNKYKLMFTWDDEQQRLSSVDDSAGRHISYRYDDGFLSGVTDVAAANWEYQYQNGLLSSVVDSEMTPVLEAAYAADKVIRTSTISGPLTYRYEQASSEYNDAIVTDADGRVSSYKHNAAGQIEKVTSATSQLTAKYDSYDRLTSLTVPQGSHLFGYDAHGKPSSYSFGRRWKNWQSDKDGKTLAVADPSGTMTFHRNGATMEARGSKARPSYSAEFNRGQLIRIRTGTQSISLSYDEYGLLKEVGRSGRKYSFRYNKFGYLVAEQFSSGYSASCTRDARGLITSWMNSEGKEFSFRRDSRGALIRVTNTIGEWAEATRDGAGRIVSLSNSDGQSRLFSYMPSGALKTYTDATGQTFNVEYDLATGKALSFTSLNGLTHNDNISDDGWHDPLFGQGLMGSFSGFSRYFVEDTITSKKRGIPPDLAKMLLAGAAATGDDSDGDDDDDDDDDTGCDSGECAQCESNLTAACEADYEVAVESASDIEQSQIATCNTFYVAGQESEYETCMAAAEYNYNVRIEQATNQQGFCQTQIASQCANVCC